MTSSQSIIPKVVETVKSSSLLAAQDVSFYASIDKDLATKFDSSAKALLRLANGLLRQINKDSGNLQSEDVSLSKPAWNEVEHVLDSSFEKVDYIMDLMRPNKNSKKQHSLLELDSSIELNRCVIEKPQLLFKNPVDNTDSTPFRPKLREKPNSIISLENSLKSKDLPINQFCHPYAHEILHSSYPASMSEPNDVVPPTDWQNTQATWVDNVTHLQTMIEALKVLNEIAVDLEHHDLHSYYGITCLMQISNRENDWIIDTIALRDDLVALNEVFTNPAIIKVFHGANMDIIWLQRDLGLYVVSLFDTYHASKALGLPKLSLAYLLETYAGFKTSKKYQLADWRIRPLPQVLLDYARADTHFLLSIFDRLRNQLISSDIENLNKVLNLSRLVACRKFEYKKFRTTSEEWSLFEELDSRVIAQNNIPQSQYPFAKRLLELRDELARELDESVRYIMPNRIFVNLCTLLLPATPESIKVALGRSLEVFESKIGDLLNLINSSPVNEQVRIVPDSDHLISSARHCGELFLQIRDIFSAEVGSNSKLALQSTLLPSVSESSALNIARKSTPLDFSFTEFGANFRNQDHQLKKRSISKEIKESLETTEDDNNGDTFEAPRSLKRRSVVSKRPRHSVENDSTYNYEGAQGKLLEAQPENRKTKKSYEPFKNSSVGGPKKAKGRKGVQTGKSVSFSKK